MTPDLTFDEGSFTGDVPLFPLPNCVLLPGGLLPLHVFEQRYRDMVRDALADQRLIAMALLKPGYESEYYECPAIEPWVCVGRILVEHQLDDGRVNMILAGLRRARILDEDRSRSYRVARVELCPDVLKEELDQPGEGHRLARLIEGLPAAAVRYPARLASAIHLLGNGVPTEAPLGTALDLAADALELTVEERLVLLQTEEVRTRLATLTSALSRRLVHRSGPRPSWPPRFSRN